MTRALVWKELREQWVVWLALALASVVGVAALHALLTPNHNRDEMLVGVLWLSAWGYGLVCGSLLLAGETEEGTQAFLDGLPGTRRRLWRVKAGAGLGFLAALSAVLGLTESLVLSEVRAFPLTGVSQVGILLYGLIGYAWGLYSGSRSATVLGAVARGVAIQLLVVAAAFPFTAVALYVFFGNHTAGMLLVGLTVALGLATTWPAVRSRLNYCHTDWQRVPPPDRRPGGPVRMDWGEAFRLAAREARWLAVGMGVFGLLGTAAVTALGAVAWPVATVLIGVVCGVTAFSLKPQSDEDGPTPARLVAARVDVRVLIAVGAAVLTASVPLGLFVAEIELGTTADLSALESRLAEGTTAALLTQPVLFLFLWLVDGLAVGLLCGVSIRRTRDASLVAVPWACLLGALWLPDVLLAERLRAWQVWVTPSILLVAVSYLMRAGARGKSSRLRTVGVTSCAGVLAVLVSGASLWYRAAEIPSPEGAIDVEAYRASLPSAGENEGGRLTAEALRRFRALEPSIPDELRVNVRSRGLADLTDLPSLVVELADQGWKDSPRLRDSGGGEWDQINARQVNARQLRGYFGALFRHDWVRDLERAAELPTGVVVDPREVLLASTVENLPAAQFAATLLVARGLQQQKDGDPAAFVGHLRTGLALARSLRHRTITQSLLVSTKVEERMVHGVELWLKALEGRPDLLRQVAEVLREHGRAPRPDLNDARKADFLVALNRVAEPSGLRASRQNLIFLDEVPIEFAARQSFEVFILRTSSDFFLPGLDRPLSPGLHFWSGAPDDAELIRASFRAPWERIRLRHMLEQAEARRWAGNPAEPELRSHSERVTDLVAPFLATNKMLWPRVHIPPNRCVEAEKLVARRLEAGEAAGPAKIPDGAGQK